jgi:hypothetical protein
MESTMTRFLHSALAITFLATVPVAVLAQSTDIDTWFERMLAKKNAGYEGVQDMTRKTEMMGTSTFEYYEKTSAIELDNGQTVYVMRMVPPSEMAERRSGGNGMSSATPGELQQAADAIEMAGMQMDQGMRSEMSATGVPGGIGTMLMSPPPDQPWLSANPRDMTSMYAMMLRAGAESKTELPAEKASAGADYARNAQQIKEQTKFLGYSEFRGRRVGELGADNLDFSESSGPQQVSCDSMRMLVDAEEYVPLLFRMNCAVTEGRETRQMSIEREDRDFRNVPGCGAMYEPFSSVMRIGGAMTPEQEAELAQASKQLEELEAQMASMPASQRRMMESMMGPQLEMIRNMASGGGIEMEQKTLELRCNTGLPDPTEVSQAMFGTPAAGGIAATGVLPRAPSGGAPADEAAMSGLAKSDLTADYLRGDWCTEEVQERALYTFEADGSYRVGVVGITITQMDGINYFPDVHSHEDFLNEFQGVGSKSQDRFSVINEGGHARAYTRGNCFK